MPWLAAAAPIIGGLVSAGGDILGSYLSPSVPGAQGILGNTMSTYTGTDPKYTVELSKLQQKLAGTTNPKAQAKIQGEIDKLQTQIGTESQLGYEPQELANLQNILPQLQAISQAQNQAGAGGALQLQQQYGLPAGQAILGAQQQLAPQFYSGQQQLGQELFGSPLGLTPAQSAYYNQQFMGNEAAMGLGSSPLGAQNAAYQLTGLNLQQANTQLGQQQSYLQNYLQPQVPNLFGTFSPTSATGLGGNMLQSLNPQDFLSLSASLAGQKYAQGISQAQALASPLTNLGNSISGMGGMSGMSGLGSFFGGGTADSGVGAGVY
jgi:hypothetical protein